MEITHPNQFDIFSYLFRTTLSKYFEFFENSKRSDFNITLHISILLHIFVELFNVFFVVYFSQSLVSQCILPTSTSRWIPRLHGYTLLQIPNSTHHRYLRLGRKRKRALSRLATGLVVRTPKEFHTYAISAKLPSSVVSTNSIRLSKTLSDNIASKLSQFSVLDTSRLFSSNGKHITARNNLVRSQNTRTIDPQA